jgi:hypothetical protein
MEVAAKCYVLEIQYRPRNAGSQAIQIPSLPI